MKTVLIIIFLTISSQIVNAQNRVFKIEKFSNNEIKETKIDTINAKQIIDLNFYRKNFSKPYLFPTEFTNLKYKNEVVVNWNSEKTEKDFKQNWTYTFTFDENSRVVKYEYSGCLVCSQLPYETLIKYDKNKRPIELIESYKTLKSVESSKNNSLHNLTSKVYKIEYNERNEVRTLLLYNSEYLIEKIELIN
ncbi:hypothetical protein [Faecalibacter bovis]|uniref:Uncharacterized protein n=1 Tax=Faecalibacter bovis TaxID=2898187 RepID=A0ABX7XAZ6_9FLAO|nr:hypothetical protein [Faecalibacter bovis]QTV05062.1 hypothetical protein J9309_09700 [Faecalibacter bovis]